jgi:hypothetical protein
MEAKRMGLIKEKYQTVIGHGISKNDTVQKAEGRLRRAWELGFMPFAMNYDKHYLSTKEWYKLQKTFCRPAATKAYMNPKTEKGLFTVEGDEENKLIV